MQIIYTKTNKDTIFIQYLRGLHYIQKWSSNISKEEEIVKFVLKQLCYTINSTKPSTFASNYVFLGFLSVNHNSKIFWLKKG